jgi:hypothetical protein
MVPLRATQLTGASTALVSLVDSTRSFFKSFRLSDGSAGEGREVPISISTFSFTLPVQQC